MSDFRLPEYVILRRCGLHVRQGMRGHHVTVWMSSKSLRVDKRSRLFPMRLFLFQPLLLWGVPKILEPPVWGGGLDIQALDRKGKGVAGWMDGWRRSYRRIMGTEGRTQVVRGADGKGEVLEEPVWGDLKCPEEATEVP